MKTLTVYSTLAILSSALGLMACATAPQSAEMVGARDAYARAEKGPAQNMNPADLHAAKSQLDAAEAAFVKDGDVLSTRDQFYVAQRRAELAEVVARTRQTLASRDEIVSQMHTDEKKVVAATSAELGRTKTQLAAQGQALAVQGEALANEKERSAELEAKTAELEKRAAQAASDLAKFATVKQEVRGMVITLSGSVLFASAKSALLPAAKLRLNDVAKALTREDPLSKMIVEGHTDSQGEASYNQDLSDRRATAVRDYLVTRGIAADRITAHGNGSTIPIADNGNAEGRANNRRVEIVVQPSMASL